MKKNIKCCLKTVGCEQLHTIPDIGTELPDPDLEASITDRMRSVFDVPFSDGVHQAGN